MPTTRLVVDIETDDGQRSVNELAKAMESMGAKAVRVHDTTAQSVAKVETSYRKVLAQLDPTVRRHQEYERQIAAINAAQRAGIGTQAEHIRALELARQKLDGNATGYSNATAAIKGYLAGLVSIGAGLALLRKAFQEAVEWDREVSQITRSIANLGATTNVTSRDAIEFANAYGKAFHFEDDQVLKAERTLIRFGATTKETLELATRVSGDVARTLGIDLVQAASMVGKAIQEPGEGMKALKSAGLDLSDSAALVAQSLAEQGRVAEAQVVVLRSLAFESEGAAAAQGDLAGGVDRLKVSWSNLLGVLGGSSGGAGGVLGGIASLLDGISNAVDFLDERISNLASNGFFGKIEAGTWKMLAAAYPLTAPFAIGLGDHGPGGAAAPAAANDNAAIYKAQMSMQAANLQLLDALKKGHEKAAKEAAAHAKAEEAAAKRARDAWQKHLNDQLVELRKSGWDQLFKNAEKLEDLEDKARAKRLENLEAERQYNASRQAASIIDVGKLREEVGWEEKKAAAQLKGKEALYQWAAAKQTADYAAATGATGKLLDEYHQLALELERLKGRTNEWAEAQKQIKENLGRGLQSAAADFFYTFATDGKKAWSSFGKSIKDLLLKSVSEWLAAMLAAQVKAFIQRMAQIQAQNAADKAGSGGGGGGGGGWWQTALKLFGGGAGGTAATASVTGSTGAVAGTSTAGMYTASGSLVGTTTTAGAGGGAAAGGAGAAAFAWIIPIAVIAGVAAWRKHDRDSDYKRIYGTTASYGMGPGGTAYADWRGALNQTGPKAAAMMKDLFASLEETAMAGITSMDRVQIKIRNDKKYFEAQVGSEVLGRFKTLEEAVIAAAKKAFLSADLTRALDPAARGAMERWSGKDPEKFKEAFRLVQSIINEVSGLSEIEAQVAKIPLAIKQMKQGLVDLGVAATDASALSIRWGVSQFMSSKDAITGRQKSPAEERADRERARVLHNAQVAMFELELKARKRYIESGLKLAQTGIAIERTELEGKIQLFDTEARLFRAELGSMAGYINGRRGFSEAQRELFEAELAVIDAALADLANAQIDVGEMRAGRGGGRGRGGAGINWHERMLSAVEGIAAAQKRLVFGELSPFTGRQKISAAEAEVLRLQQLYARGDRRSRTIAMEGLPEAIETYLSLFRSTRGATGAYEVEALRYNEYLSQILRDFGRTPVSAVRQAANENAAAMQRIFQRDARGKLHTRNEELEDELAENRRELQRSNQLQARMVDLLEESQTRAASGPTGFVSTVRPPRAPRILQAG